MYKKIIESLLAVDKSDYIRYDALTETLVVSTETHEMMVTPTVFSLSAVTYTQNVMDRAKSLPLTKEMLVIIHHEMFLNETDWEECCEVSRKDLNAVINYYRKFG